MEKLRNRQLNGCSSIATIGPLRSRNDGSPKLAGSVNMRACEIFNTATRSCIATIVLACPFWQSRGLSAQPSASLSDNERVGAAGPETTITPVNQVLTPYGRKIDLPDSRPQAVALSPDGKLLITAG